MKAALRRPLQPSYASERAARRKLHHEEPKRHEESTARALGGRRQKGSGSCYDAKGDVAGVEAGRFDLHGECKRSTKQSYTLSIRTLNKITSEAADLLKSPFLAVRFDESLVERLAAEQWQKTGRPVTAAEADWIAVPRSLFVQLLEMCGEEFDDDG
jgi:hypothetical protein